MRQIALSVLEYPTETKALVRLQEDVLRINDPKAFKAHNKPTLGLVIDRFITEERLEEIVTQPPGETSIIDGLSWSTAASYRSNLKTHIRPKWGVDPLVAADMVAVFTLIAKNHHYPDTLGFEAEFKRLVAQWRPQLVSPE